MSFMFRKLPVKLQDCRTHGVNSGAELFIVEGDSASQAVTAIRDEKFQAVLPMQGKPLNATKASAQKVRRFELFAELLRSLGYAADEPASTKPVDPGACRFERIIFLFDPDADGIHCEALMLMFFHQALLPLLASGKVHSVRAPMFRFTLEHPSPANEAKPIEPPHYAYSEAEAMQLFAQLESLDIQVKRIRYRGLAGMHRESLLETCVSPASRKLRRITTLDAEAAISVFGAS